MKPLKEKDQTSEEWWDRTGAGAGAIAGAGAGAGAVSFL